MWKQKRCLPETVRQTLVCEALELGDRTRPKRPLNMERRPSCAKNFEAKREVTTDFKGGDQLEKPWTEQALYLNTSRCCFLGRSFWAAWGFISFGSTVK